MRWISSKTRKKGKPKKNPDECIRSMRAGRNDSDKNCDKWGTQCGL